MAKNDNKNLMILLWTFVGLVVAAVALMDYGIDLGAWSSSLIGIMIGLILLIKIGVKLAWPFHRITSMTALQWVTLSVAVSNIIVGVLMLPMLTVSIPLTLSVGLKFAASTFIFAELYSQLS